MTAQLERMSRVQLGNGQHLAFDEVGSGGLPALLLHGLPGSRLAWAGVVRCLRGVRRLIVPDLLGFGDSSPLVDGQHAEAEARAVLALLDELDVPEVDLVGHDFGGPTALWLVRLAPRRVRTLALIATNAFRDTPIPGPLKLAKVPGLGELMFRMMCSRPGLDMLWGQAVRNRSGFSLAAFRVETASRVGRATTRAVFLESLRRLDGLYAEVEAALTSIAVPSAVYWGDADPFFPRKVGERLAAAIPGATLTVLADCGHFVPQERPDELSRALREHWQLAAGVGSPVGLGGGGAGGRGVG